MQSGQIKHVEAKNIPSPLRTDYITVYMMNGSSCFPFFTADPTVLVKWTYPADLNDWRCLKADTVLQWARNMMVHGSFRRGDHWELLELVVHYLGSVVLRPRASGASIEGFQDAYHTSYKCVWHLPLPALIVTCGKTSMNTRTRSEMEAFRLIWLTLQWRAYCGNPGI